MLRTEHFLNDEDSNATPPPKSSSDSTFTYVLFVVWVLLILVAVLGLIAICTETADDKANCSNDIVLVLLVHVCAYGIAAVIMLVVYLQNVVSSQVMWWGSLLFVAVEFVCMVVSFIVYVSAMKSDCRKDSNFQTPDIVTILAGVGVLDIVLVIVSVALLARVMCLWKKNQGP
jgi:magnesium-transporting ATPase (P-type)